MRRHRHLNQMCADCGEVEIDDRKATGTFIRLVLCDDDKWRCTGCIEDREQEECGIHPDSQLGVGA